MDSGEHAYDYTGDCRKRRRLSRNGILKYSFNCLGGNNLRKCQYEAIICADPTY